MLQVLTLDEARVLLLNIAEKVEKTTERARLSGLFGRVLAEDVFANEDLPSFRRSAVDGYAVRASDTFGASAAQPALLHLCGEVNMGERAGFALESGACAAVFTGGELPDNADAMVMLEEAERLPNGMVAAERAAAPGNHIVYRGDDAKRGALLLPAGRRLFARDVGLLAAFGCSEAGVFARPRVGIVSTGDELIDPAETPQGAQVRDANGPMLAAACTQAGAEARFWGRVPDDEEALLSAMRLCANQSDLMLVSGGSSAGARDAVARCLGRLGSVFFHGLALKPGKPALAGLIGRTIVIGLPGHPAAAYLVFHALVLPLLAALAGETYCERTAAAELTEPAPSNHGREELLLVSLNGGEAKIVHSKSGLVSPLSRADGYVRIPRDAEGLQKGARVKVILFE